MTWDRHPSADTYEIDQPYGMIAMDQMNEGSSHASSRILGCIAYGLDGQNIDTNYSAQCCSSSDYTANFKGGFFVANMNSIEIRDSIAYIEHAGIRKELERRRS